MICCESCRSELPANAQFCGNCGYKFDDRYTTVTDIENPLEKGVTERQTPPLFSSPLNPTIQSSGMGWQNTNSTFQTRWDIENLAYSDSQSITRNTGENDTQFPDLLVPGMLALQSQVPSPSQPPMVQGTPQFGGVPSVQGTPAAPGNVAQSIPGPVHGAASSAPSYAPQEAQADPIQHRQIQQPRYQPTPQHHQPVSHSQPAPPKDELEHQYHHAGSLHQHKSHLQKLHHSGAIASTNAGMSALSKWIIITIVALVIVGTSSVLLAHAIMPTTPTPVLSITGSHVVSDGGILHVHGQGFQPGDGITLTIDNGLPVTLAGSYGTQAASNGTEGNAHVTGMSQMNIMGVFQSHSSVRSNVSVNSTGTFDVDVTVPSNLPTGQHMIRAKDNQSSQSASLQFTISSSQLVVNPAALHFGSVEVGRTVKLLLTLSNEGGASLPWTATVEGSNTNWLTLSRNSDVLGTNGANETVIVTANTNGLTVGPRNATVRFHSANGDVLIAVNIHVVSTGQSGQQAILNVSQQSLDFGQLQAGQLAHKNVSIANLGNLPLQWQASTDAASANWLSLSTSKGTVQTGAVPQSVLVNVDTSGLAAGTYSGTIHITSNGGNAQVKVTLVVKGTSTKTPTITGISPASGPGTGGTSVTITGTGFTGATSVSFGTTVASNVSLKSDIQITATSPAGSGTVDITVTTPVGKSTTSSADQFTYTTPLPRVTSINPTSGSSNGGTTVTITGTGFSGATSVTFGQKPASNFTVASDTQITATSPAGSGTVDVIITTTAGTSATGTSDQFTYMTPSPRVTGLKPNNGLSNGGTSVTIDGTAFTGATSVSFGTTPASNFTVMSDTQIMATSPAGRGTVDITVTTPGGTSATGAADQFTYTAPVPTVTSITPKSGNTTGGTTVTITGTGFTGTSSVTFGQTAASNFTVVSDTQITATSAAGSGTVDVTVTTSSGTSATSSADQFTYMTPPPTITSISPQGGYTTGGTNVTITGTGFTGATNVSFGKTAASKFTIVSDTQITVSSPPVTSTGTVDVTVSTPGGTSTISTSDQFTYSSSLS